MDQEPRGILKKDVASASGRHATWDEGNLARNEDIKAELNPTKIDEPKTPYHAPVDPDVEMVPLDLDSGEPPGSTSVADDALRGAEAHSAPSTSQPAADDADHIQDDTLEKQEEFEQHRKQHYDMKSALAAGKALLEREQEADAAGDDEPASVA